jgi:putative transposase
LSYGYYSEAGSYITGTADQELFLRNEYLVAENHILREQVNGRLLRSNAEKKTLAEIGYRLGRKTLEDVAKCRKAGKPDTILGWYRKLVAQKFDIPRHVERLADLK